MRKTVSGIMFALLLVGTLTLASDIQPVKSEPAPYVSVEPDSSEFGPALCMGQEFSLVIWGHDFDATARKIAGFEVHVLIDMVPGYLIDATPGFTNFIGQPGGLFEGESPERILYGIPMGWYETRGSDRTFKFACAYGDGWTPPEAFKLAEIKLKIFNQPDGFLGESDVSVPVALVFTDVVDDALLTVPHEQHENWATWNGARITIHALPFGYPSTPLIEISPPYYKPSAKDEEFDVSIFVNCSSWWDISGFEITLLYDHTVLTVVAATEGNFLKQHGVLTWGWIDTATPGRIWAVFVKLENPIPSFGRDTLIVIRFKAASPAGLCIFELTDLHLSSWPHPERHIPPWAGNPYSVELPKETPKKYLLGDLSLDGTIGLSDLVSLAKGYGSKLGDVNWNPLADLAEPWNIIGLADLVTLASYYKQHNP